MRDPHAWRFLGLLALWNAALFGMLRTSWFTSYAAMPFTHAQAAIAAWYGGVSSVPVSVTLECSGTDVMALCAALILAFPATWRQRAAGVALVIPALLLTNIVRIVTLSLAAGTPDLFRFLHLYAWPTALLALAGGLALLWMRSVGTSVQAFGRGARVALYTLGGFAVATPLLEGSQFVAWAGRAVAGASAYAMSLAGANAAAAGPMLATPRGSFIVTPDCLLSPILPLWVFAVFYWPLTRAQRVAALMLTLPLAFVMACGRLLVLAAPGAWVASPLFVVHGFYQLVVFAGLVLTAALHRDSGVRWAESLRRAALITVVAGVSGAMLGSLHNTALTGVVSALAAWAPHVRVTLASPSDVQGALVLLPAYQAALFAALLWAYGRPVAPRHVAAAVVALVGSQIGLLVALGELATHTGLEPPVVMVRGWAVAWPVALAFLLWSRPPADGVPTGDGRRYRAFWNDVGATFPDLGGARSTALYAEHERRLIVAHLGPLAGRSVLKTDLWDEARNTRILQWVQGQGARVTGIDIAPPVVQMARGEFGGAPLGAAAADVRRMPFPDGSFDAVYSMGTIEHFDETEEAVREIHRVLKPGGRAIVGVPNRHDPFLRPLMVAILWRLGLYGYGFEKSYSRAGLRRMLARAGFTVVADDGILFVPGWLRMLDLLLHARCRPLAFLTAAPVGAFAWLGRCFPALQRHGYLIAAIGERPSAFSANGAEWIVDARGCDPAKLQSTAALEGLFADLMAGARLRPIGQPQWRTFDGAGGVTGLQMLSESHLACHTYPESGYAAFSMYCCREMPVDWPWEARLREALGARDVLVRVVPRGPGGRAWLASDA